MADDQTTVDDTLIGSGQDDGLNGGTDAVRFCHFGSAAQGSDWIQNYTAAQGDILQFGGTATADQLQVIFTETEGECGRDRRGLRDLSPIGTNPVGTGGRPSAERVDLLLDGVTYDLLA